MPEEIDAICRRALAFRREDRYGTAAEMRADLEAFLGRGTVDARKELASTMKLLFVGRDFDTKAGAQVVAAFQILRQRRGEAISLTVAGPPVWPMKRLPAGVHFLGAVPPAEVRELYDSHDLFVMPSHFEGFGIVFAEALSRGLPCIGRRACAMPEIIDPWAGGLLIETTEPEELAEAIVATLGDDGLYERCASAAGGRSAYYTWDRAAQQVLTAMGS